MRIPCTRRSDLLLPMFVAAMSASAAATGADWPAATLGSQAVWDAATDRVAQSRFIPMQLIVPGVWDGARRISLPTAAAFDAEGTVWTGPQEWRNPYTGKTLTVYDRRRTTRRQGAVEQKMALRLDGSAIGRAYDS